MNNNTTYPTFIAYTKVDQPTLLVGSRTEVYTTLVDHETRWLLRIANIFRDQGLRTELQLPKQARWHIG